MMLSASLKGKQMLSASLKGKQMLSASLKGKQIHRSMAAAILSNLRHLEPESAQ